MVWANLDMIVKRTLLERGLSIHWYAEVLFHQSAAIRELAKRRLKLINAANLPVNDYFAVDLPSDFKDDLAVCIPVGGLLQPIPKRESINPLRLHSAEDGSFIPYENANFSNSGTQFFGFAASWNWYWNVNDYGEPTGRFFGANGGSRLNGYKVVKERRQIQLTNTFTSPNIILLYVGNGQSADNATQVEWDAFRAIQAYSDWQMSPNAAIKDSYEAATFYNEDRLLGVSDMTVTDIKEILRSNYTAAIKN